MFVATAIFSFTFLAAAYGQQAGIVITETHPRLTWQQCSVGGNCTTVQGSVVLDANKRWLHTTGGTNCYTGNTWKAELCPEPVTCAKGCALDGADYSGSGVTTSGNSIRIKFDAQSSYLPNAGPASRVYLMASNDTSYQLFKLLNSELSFDVDASMIPCDLNGALYFAQMDADGGTSKYPNNKAGAKYGTGYCDAQCPRDLTFINGEANLIDWTPSNTDPNAGAGRYGSCCNEMDVWESNKVSNAYITHGCKNQGQTRCSGTTCGSDDSSRYSGICDKDGCDFNPYRMGDKSFYGPGMTIDTSSKFTVVTQFLTSTNTSTGPLSEIRRLYIQKGKVIQNSKTLVDGLKPYDSITTDYCNDQKAAFGDTNDFAAKGGLAPISQAMSSGMVLVMSISNDPATRMQWLDGNYPPSKDPSNPGVARGTCPDPTNLAHIPEEAFDSSWVIFSNIKFGPIGATYAH